MSAIDDQILSAYLDGELDRQTSSKVEAAVRSDPAIARRLEQLKMLNVNLGSAYAGAMDEPVPQRLSAMLAGGRGAKAHGIRLPRLADLLRPIVVAPAFASLAVGILAGTVTTAGVATTGVMVADKAGELRLAGNTGKAVDVARSGVVQTVGDVRVLVRLSFRDGSGRACRHVSLSTDDVVVCRHSGGWVVDSLAPGPGVSGEGYQTAASPAPREISAAMTRLQVATAFDAEEEAAMIRSGWKKGGP
jgi:hypothetical protein